MNSVMIPWSDNWWIEGDKAWFCAGEINAVFCVDMISQRCEFVAQIPECALKDFRLYPFCIKREKIVYCLPDIGNMIWYYDIEQMHWGRIEIGNKARMCVNTDSYAQTDKYLWLLEEKTCTVLKINLEKKVLEAEYSDLCSSDVGSAIFGSEYILVNNIIYFSYNMKIYSFNTKDEKLLVYEVPEIGVELFCICYDGTNFWLNGYSKEIYVWNPEYGIVKTLNVCSDKIVTDGSECEKGILPFLFHFVSLKNYIWCIPFELSDIMYIDKNTFEISFLSIEEEQQSIESVKDNLIGHKYLVEYVRENRYIGVYSLKNQCIFEIDTLELCVEKKKYKLSDAAIQYLSEICFMDGAVLSERSDLERTLFTMILDKKYERTRRVHQKIGEIVFQSLV